MTTYLKSICVTALAAFLLAPVVAFSGEYCPPACAPCSSCDNCGYVFAYGGWAEAPDLSGTSIETLGTFNIESEYDDGYIVGAGVGVYSCFLGGTRFEIEGLYTESELLNERANGVIIPGYTGEIKSKAVFINALKEIPMGCFTGYVGGGCGFVNSDLSFRNSTLFGGRFFDSSSDTAFSCQFIAGVDVPVSDCLSIFFQYKLMNVGDMQFDCTDPNAAVPGQRKLLNVDSYIQNALVVGGRISF